MLPFRADAPLKVTPSMLTFLWDDCPRCFWLYARGLHRPQMPFPRVFERYHDALSSYCLGRCPSELDAALPAGRFVAGELWVRSRPLRPDGHEAALYLLGRLDHLAHFDDGSFGIVDFKMTDTRADLAARYARQLHAYAWALEQAAPDAPSHAPVTRLGLFCLHPVRAHGRDGRFWAELQPRWVEIPRDDDAFARFLADVLRLLTRPDPPPAGVGCSCCQYWHRRRTLEASLNGRGDVW